MDIEKEIFNECSINYNKLIPFGFKKINNKYYYEKLINNNKFKVIITIDNGNIFGKIDDLKMNEEYFNYRIESNNAYSNLIREEYINILNNIKEKCFKYKKKVNSWIIPSNQNRFDIIEYFNKYDTIIWHQKINVQIDDFVYVYVSKPYSCILYKCKVIRNNFAHYSPRCMELKLIKKYKENEYPISFLKQMGLNNVMYERSLSLELSEYLSLE